MARRSPAPSPASAHEPPSAVHGLAYPPSFLDACPVLLARPAPHTPIRALSAQAFADAHLTHLTAHAPDSALFPFLHGLEGDNDAQNRFFGAHIAPPRAPRFRGLVWVAADEPLGSGAGSPAPREPLSSDGEDDFESETGLSDLSAGDDAHLHPHPEDTFGLSMDVDDDAPGAGTLLDPNAGTHMHPVAHRAYGLEPGRPIAIANSHDRRASDAASSVVSSAPSIFSRGRSFSTASTAPTQASPPTSPKAAGLGTLADYLHAQDHHTGSRSPPRAIAHTLPHFTSTFRAHELLQTDAAGNLVPEFLSPKVPTGISLRNFGIQVVRSLPHTLNRSNSPR
jgi:dual specificity MAP kinase phosphatase